MIQNIRGGGEFLSRGVYANDKNSSIIKIFIVYEFLPSTRFLCEKAEQRKMSGKKAKKRNRWQPCPKQH